MFSDEAEATKFFLPAKSFVGFVKKPADVHLERVRERERESPFVSSSKKVLLSIIARYASVHDMGRSHTSSYILVVHRLKKMILAYYISRERQML